MIETSPSGPTAARERFAWVLLPLALIAYGCALLYGIAAISGVIASVDAVTSNKPITVTLHGQTELPQAAGTHSYSGGPYIADDAIVTATSATADVSGIDTPSRLALRLGPTLWSLTIVTVGIALGMALARLRRPDRRRDPARPIGIAALALAVGSTFAQIAVAWGDMRLGHVAWIGPDGIDGFTAIDDVVFDFTPLAIAAGLLAVVVIVRRTPDTR